MEEGVDLFQTFDPDHERDVDCDRPQRHPSSHQSRRQPEQNIKIVVQPFSS